MFTSQENPILEKIAARASPAEALHESYIDNDESLSFARAAGGRSGPPIASNAAVLGTSGHDFLSITGVTDDSLAGFAGNDTLLGHGGVDQLSGGDGHDSLDGGALADILHGDGGNDTLFGGDGWDILNGGSGADWLNGGNDADIFLIDFSTNPLQASAFLAADTIADFSLSHGDSVSFGLGNGVLEGSLGPAPLIWRGALATHGGPVAGLALPGHDLGLGYLQAWYIPVASTDTVPGGWIVIDHDQNNVLGNGDLMIRIMADPVMSENFYAWVAPGNFAGFTGSSHDDVISAAPSGSRLFGLGGADLLLGAAAPDWLSGGAGADTLSGLGADDQLWGGAGNDWIYGGDGNDALYADGPTADDMDGAIALNLIDGEAGRDSLFGGTGSDHLLGGNDDDLLYGADGADTLDGGAGHDRLIGGEGDDSLVGGAGADTLEGGGGDDRLIMQDASDWLDGGDGFDWLTLSIGFFINLALSGNQVTHGAWIAGFEAVDARAANAAMTLNGSAEGNHLLGGSASDSLIGNDGDDYLLGGAGNDTLSGGRGQNVLEGGLGNDLYQINSTDDLPLEYPNEGADTILADIDFHLPTEFETLILSATGQTRLGFGNEGHNLLIGNAQANGLSGGGGNDTLQGEGGDDTLQGEGGNDLLIGGAGAGDWASYSDLTEFGQSVSVNLIAGVATGAAGSDQLQGIEHVLSGAGRDQLIGNGGANRLSAGAGADTLWGDAGADTLDGGEHDDTLHGGSEADLLIGGVGHDSIFGDTGNDTLDGGAGADTMAGGSGDDLYFFVDSTDRVIETAGGGQDTIITSTNVALAAEVEVLIVAEGAENLVLIGRSAGSLMVGNGLGHHFQGGRGDDVILAGGGSLADILAIFAT